MIKNDNFSNHRYIFLIVIIMVGTFIIVSCQSNPEEVVSEEVLPEEIVSEEVSSEEVVTNFIDSINSKDGDSAITLLSDNINIDFGEQDSLSGKDDVQAWFTEMFGQNLKIEVQDTQENDGVVTMQTDVTWTGLSDWYVESLSGTTETKLDSGLISEYHFRLDEKSRAALPILITSADDLTGVWQRAKAHPAIGKIFLQVFPDGTYRQATGSFERLESTPMVEGSFEFDQGRFIITHHNQLVDNYLWTCDDPAMVGEYNVSQLSNGNIKYEVVHEECRGREDNFASEYILLEP